METITTEKKEYMCKFCNKKFPSGKSLGGHIRIHTNHHYSLHSHTHNGKNPKKKLVDQRALQQQQHQLCCRECGKGFDSLKDLWSHMDCCHCLVMDTETSSSGSSRKRSKTQSGSESFSNGSSSSSSSDDSCEIEEEHKNTALTLMMMSMDSRGLSLVVNSLVAGLSSDDSGAILSDSYSSDSDYFMNGPKKSDSAILVDECLGNTGFNEFRNGDELGINEGRSKYELRKSKRLVFPCDETDSCAVDTKMRIHSKSLMVSKKAVSAKKNSKGHECPICFRVFKSGQALGGHKRSHFLGNHELRIKHKAAAEMEIDLNNLPAHDI